MITLIACVDNNFGIGKDNDLLVKIPQDMKHFKNHTKGNICVFGRKTAESLPNGEPLKDRTNVILTRDKEFMMDGFHIANDIKTILSMSFDNHVYICGGAELYDIFMPHADEVILTSLSETYEADTFFPHVSMYSWMSSLIADDLAISDNSYECTIEGIEAGVYDDGKYTILKYKKVKREVDLDEQ